MVYINKKIYKEIKIYWERYQKYHLLIMTLKKELEIIYKDLDNYTNSHTIDFIKLRNSIKNSAKNRYCSEQLENSGSCVFFKL